MTIFITKQEFNTIKILLMLAVLEIYKIYIEGHLIVSI